jgi:putative ABC transport system permease protein
MEWAMGKMKLAFFLAYKSILKGNYWTLILIILVTSLSFSNLILTPSLMSGVTAALNQQQIETLFGNIIVDPPPDLNYLTDISQIESKLAAVPELSGVAPHLNNGALFEYKWHPATSFQDKGQSGNWSVIGIDPAKETTVTTIHSSIIAGSYLNQDDRDQIVLGVEIAGGSQTATLPELTLGGVQVGDIVRLTYANAYQHEYTVKGIFKAREGGANNLAFITRQDMTAVLGSAISEDSANQILVRTKPGVDESQLIAKLKTLDINAQIRGWEDYGRGVGGIVSSFGAVTSIIGAIGLIVAGVVMFIVIYINVTHRKRQIGILRAIGVDRGVVMISYLLQAVLYAVLGIIFGGLILGYGIKPFFDAHPIDLPIGLVSLVVDQSTVVSGILWLMVASLLAGIIPVLNITRESIIKAIWGN